MKDYYTRNLKILRSLDTSYDFNFLKLTNKLLLENKINKEFLVTLSCLSLEELVSLKLESLNNLFRGKFVGFNLLSLLRDRVEELVISFAFDNFRKLEQIKIFLGLTDKEFYRIVGKYRKDIKKDGN